MTSNNCTNVDLGDPDVTGFGVLISFFASIVFVLVAMIAAYPLDALPKSCYNDLDDLLLGRYRRRTSSFSRAPPPPPRTDGKHTDAFQTFMLSLSDQQLFAGLALAVTLQVVHHGLYDLDTGLSAYAYCNAVVLAVFSCTIHLASLATLRGYFGAPRRAWLKHARCALMLVVLALVAQPLAEMYRMLNFLDDLSESLRCALQELPASSWDTPVGPTGDGGMEYKKPAFIMGLVVIFGVLGRAYLHRLSDLYPVRWASVAAWPRRCSEEQLQAARAKLAAGRSDSQSSSSLATFFFVFLPEFHGSFVFNLVWLLFFFTIGLVGLIQSLVGQLNNQHDTLSDISIRPNFGQLLPLVLLGLPAMAMAEAYSDTAKTAEPPSDQGPPPGPSPSGNDDADEENKPAWGRSNPTRPGPTSPFARLTSSRPSTWRRRCAAFTGLYALVAIYVALAVTWAFSALTYNNSTRVGHVPSFISDPDALMIFLAFVFVAAWSLTCLAGAAARAVQLRREVLLLLSSLEGGRTTAHVSSSGGVSVPPRWSSYGVEFVRDGEVDVDDLPESSRRSTV